MSLLINLIPLEAGGGLQNACSFLLAAPLGRDCEVHARRLKSIQSALVKREIPLRAIPHGAMYRLRAEWGIARKGDGKQVCFTLFGPPPVFSKGRLINVVGCAYANLFYPELDFWSNHKGLARLKKTVIDWYRRWGIARADYWIFETDAIARRAIERFSFPPDRVFVVRMAPSRLVLESVTTRTFPELPPDRFLTLYLAGPHPNKRIGALIDVALALHARADTRFCFVLTLPPDAPQTRLLMERIARYGLERYFVNVGTVKPEHAGALIRRCHAMCNLARLESFSSNFVEAWAMRKPLLVTDADWSRASCADGAVYVHPERPQTIVAALQRLHEDKDFYASLVARGAGVLDTYPSAEQKAEHYLEIIRRRDLTSYRGPSVWRKRAAQP
ncbi:transferase (plasmid) [Ralstonia solanacearum]|uniref:glycosyltransferase family 4 protein n=1 Tax=Ralstonia pseudosolanacearum TaxID=1310165 RepID=UPI000C9F69E8|nr:glycosyltransferase family 4 protein [Ralstonia pseudosolanacearum]AUS45318.1 transferase [Ralstonia solanacearum]